jgi:hypothetical protein
MGRGSFLRTIFCFAIAGVLLFGYVASHASAEKLTAADWKRITAQRKLYFVFASCERLQEEGTVFRRSAEAYVQLLDREAAAARPADDMDVLFRSLAAAETASHDTL